MARLLPYKHESHDGDLIPMKLKSKILVGYSVAFVLMSVVIAWAVMNLVSLGKATDAILRENYRSILAAENMVDALERQDSAILIVILGDKESGIKQFRDNEAVFIEWLARSKDNITIQGEGELVQNIESRYSNYRGKFSELTDLSNNQTSIKDLSLTTYQDTIFPLFEQVRESCIRLRRLNEETMYAASVNAGKVASRAIWSTVLIAITTLIAALIFSFLLAERIVRPLRRFMEASRIISSGDYSVKVPIETKDELGGLAKEFNEMAAQLDRFHEMNIEQIIAEKNKSEAILFSIEDGIVVFDTHRQVIAMNPAVRRILNLEFSEHRTLKAEDILPDSYLCETILTISEKGILPEIPEERRILSLKLDNRSHHYLFSITSIVGKEQHMSGIVLLLRDVTHLKEVERLKSEFVMAASHELRTPLTSLGMSVDLLLEHVANGLEPKDRELLQAAHEEVHRMKSLVSDLLDLSKIEAGRIDLEFENIPVHTILDHVYQVFKNQLEINKIQYSTEFEKELPKVRVDANKITWVLSNLISNAMRYVSRDGQIEIKANKIGPNVHLSVRDNGPGIPEEYHSKIFQKFVQVKGQEAGGTGLGLAICKEIIRAHGGSIWVESSPGNGSTFTFTLPIAA